MDIKKRRETEKNEMKWNIIKAAIELIEEEGYEKVSIRKIAAKINYSPTTIYLYYKDKAEIIADMCSQLYLKIERRAAAVCANPVDASIEQQVRSLLHLFIQTLCEEPEMAKAIMYSGTRVIFANDSTNHTPTNSGIAMLDQIFADGIEQKVLKPYAAETSWMILSASLGFVLGVIENQLYQLDDFDQLVENFVEIIMGGIRQ